MHFFSSQPSVFSPFPDMPSTHEEEPEYSSCALLISDIAFAVCRLVEVADGARLMRTCRAIFPVAAMRVWETVHDHRALLGLMAPQNDPNVRPDRLFKGYIQRYI